MTVLDSIRAQTSLTLAAGVVAVLLIGVLIAGWSLGTSDDGYRGSLESAMVALAASADRLPPETRPILAEAAGRAGIVLREGTSGTLVGDIYTDAMADRLRERLAPLGIRVVAAGHEALEPNDTTHLWGHLGDIVVRLRLGDTTILELAEPGHWSLPDFLLQVLPVILAVGLGLAVLSVWVARRVTAPLERFAVAAERLGRDVHAPPLAENGPREIRRAATVLNRAQRRIQRLLADRTQMLAAIAHDLRTPIMRLHLRAELMPDEDQQAKMTRDLEEMQAMITAALEFARRENDAPRREPVRLGELIGELRDELAEAGDRVAVRGGPDVVLEADPAGLKRALRNLLENAVRYGECAIVGWRLMDDRAEVVIEDQGPGIPEAEHERVFAPFYRLEPSRSRDSGGTGLGMTVARSVVRAHGGDIRLENRLEHGLRQIVTLPRLPAGR